MVLLAAILMAGCLPEAPKPDPSQQGLAVAAVGATPAPTLPLAVSPATALVQIHQTLTLTASGGTPPYSFAVTSGAGSIVVTGNTTGAFTASSSTGNVSLKVSDAAGIATTATLQVILPAPRSPNDSLFSTQYGLHYSLDKDIDAPEAWGLQTDCSSVLVGVIDTGSDMSHPDLLNNLWTNPGEIAANGVDDDNNGYVDDVHGYNFVPGAANPGDPSDDHFHGTHVAGTIGASGNNGVGVTGVCWRAKIVSLKAGNQDGALYSSAIISSIQYAIDNHIKVLNNSYGGAGFSQNTLNKIISANQAGILFVAAAGNGGSDGIGDNNDTVATYPANYDAPNIVTVGATLSSTASAGTLAAFSNYGASSVDIAAPGTSIRATTPTASTAAMSASAIATSYAYLQGTSMASPLVAGSAALAWAYQPVLSHLEVRDLLLSAADINTALSNKIAGSRQLNLYRMLNPNHPR